MIKLTFSGNHAWEVIRDVAAFNKRLHAAPPKKTEIPEQQVLHPGFDKESEPIVERSLIAPRLLKLFAERDRAYFKQDTEELKRIDEEIELLTNVMESRNKPKP